MKEFLAFISKEFRHIFRDRRTMLIVLVMPVVQIILFGFAISTEIHHVGVDVVGDATDPEVSRIMERIDGNEYLEINRYLTSDREIASRFRRGEANVAICFERDFGKQLARRKHAAVKIIGDGSDPNTAQMTVNYVAGVLQAEQSDLSRKATGKNLMAAMTPRVKYAYNPGLKSAYNFVPGVMGLILMLICSMMTAVSIVREKEMGTMEVLLVSPVRPMWMIVSKAVPYLALSAVNFTTILLLSKYLMGVPLRGSLALLCLVAFVFVLASLALGLLISVIASTQQEALLISGMGLMMPTMIFSGIIFPCESMPVILQYVSDLLPAKWFIMMAKKVMIQGVGLDFMLTEFCVLSAMAVILLVVCVRLFKERLQ